MQVYSLIPILIILSFLTYTLLKNKRAVICLVLANIFIFSFFIVSFRVVGPERSIKTLIDLMFFPSDMLGYRAYTAITSAFLHIEPMHILMNMIFLFLLGFPLEIKAGPRKVVVIYLISAVGASFLYAALSYPDNIPALGASGAIAGLMGALVALYPREEIPMFLGPIFLLRTPVYLAAMIFIVTETAYAFASTGDNVARTAHIGGILTGMVVGAIFSKFAFNLKTHTKKYGALRVLADTPELAQILDRIEEEDNEEIARAWVEEFIKEVRCPVCGKDLRLEKEKLRCDCGYILNLRSRE